MRSIKNILLICSLIFSINAYSDEQSKAEKVNAVIEYLDVDLNFQAIMDKCVDSTLSAYYSPSESFKRNGSYYGFTPNSKEWSRINEIFRKYVNQSCRSLKLPEIRELYFNYYNSNSSEVDLENWLVFMRTPAGQNFRRIQDDFIKYFNTFYYKRFSDVNEKANNELIRSISELENNNNNLGGWDTILAELFFMLFALTWLTMFYLLFIKGKKN